jgi:hypothetical protein
VFKQSAIRAACLGAVMVLAAGSNAMAQLQFNPSLGFYVPHGRPLLTQSGANGTEVRRKQAVGAPVFTTRAGLTVSPMLGVEASLSYSPGLIAVHSATGRVEDITAGLVLLSARTLFRVAESNSFEAHLTSGVGMVTRIGTAWSDTPAKPAIAFVLGGGGLVPLTARGTDGVAIRFDLEDYLSFAQFGLPDGTRSKAHPYHDLVWSLGLAIPIRGGR